MIVGLTLLLSVLAVIGLAVIGLAVIGLLFVSGCVDLWREDRHWRDWARRQKLHDEEFERRAATGAFVSKYDRAKWIAKRRGCW
jgi:hypothetical protein